MITWNSHYFFTDLLMVRTQTLYHRTFRLDQSFSHSWSAFPVFARSASNAPYTVARNFFHRPVLSNAIFTGANPKRLATVLSAHSGFSPQYSFATSSPFRVM